ncbi:MAG: hexose kinase [Phycisphaerae bacterium]
MTSRNFITVGLNPAIDCVLQCDGFWPGRVNSGRQLARIAAGKAANVTRALALLGQDVVALGFMGDSDWAFFNAQLHQLSPGAVACHFSILPQSTRQNITILNAGVETHIRLRGFAVTEADIATVQKHLMETAQTGDVVIFSGSLPEGLSVQQFGQMLDIVLTRGAKVAVDTAGAALAAALTKPLWIVKPNAEELAEVWGTGKLNTPAAIKTAAAEKACPVENLLVSRGKLGVVLVRADGCFSGSVSTRRQVVRTVACGDHLLAGFSHGLWNGKSPTAALDAGLALATARAVSANLEFFDSLIFSKLLGHAVIESV